MTTHAKKDLYRVLSISPDASLNEIKTSYRKLVWKLHPDRHSPETKEEKTRQFKDVNEAYSVLSDEGLRRQYDASRGIRNLNSTSNLHWKNRNIYAPQPPPHWKGRVWNHQEHYDFHYGDGFQRQAFDRMARDRDGFRSPLGRGFSFSQDPSENVNPYSKRTPQGPPKMKVEYEEAYVDASSGRKIVNRKEQVIQDLHGRRIRRRQRTWPDTPATTARYNATFAPDSNSCVLL